MADAQDLLEAAVPAAQTLVQVPPVAQIDVANPQENPAPLQVQRFFSLLLICSSDCFSFFPADLRPFPFPSPLSFHVAAL